MGKHAIEGSCYLDALSDVVWTHKVVKCVAILELIPYTLSDVDALSDVLYWFMMIV